MEKAKNPPRTHTTIEMATARGQIHELTKTIDIVVQEHDIQVSICVVSSPEKVPKKKKKTKENRHSKHTQKLKSKRRQSQQSHPYQIAPSSSSSSQHQQLVAARHCVYDTVFSGHFDRELRTMPAALAAFIAPNASVATP